jgi:N-acetylneuraminate lyase
MFTGIIPALLTPFTPDDRVDVQAIYPLVEFLLAAGVDGFYVCGSTGEGVLMSEEERRLVAETAVAAARRRVPVIVHVGAASTGEAVRLADHARLAGADAIAAVPPFYFSHTREGLETHYRRISRAGGLPFIFYNLPDATRLQISAELALTLYKEGTIHGLKYTSYDLFNLRAIIDACGENFNVLCGPDEELLPFLVMGAHGGIGTTYNCMPEVFRALFDAWKAGNLAAAQQLQYRIDRIVLALVKYGVIPAVKAAMEMRSISCGAAREPLPGLSAAKKEQLRHELEAVGFFAGVQEQVK